MRKGRFGGSQKALLAEGDGDEEEEEEEGGGRRRGLGGWLRAMIKARRKRKGSDELEPLQRESEADGGKKKKKKKKKAKEKGVNEVTRGAVRALATQAKTAGDAAVAAQKRRVARAKWLRGGAAAVAAARGEGGMEGAVEGNEAAKEAHEKAMAESRAAMVCVHTTPSTLLYLQQRHASLLCMLPRLQPCSISSKDMHRCCACCHAFNPARSPATIMALSNLPELARLPCLQLPACLIAAVPPTTGLPDDCCAHPSPSRIAPLPHDTGERRGGGAASDLRARARGLVGTYRGAHGVAEATPLPLINTTGNARGVTWGRQPKSKCSRQEQLHFNKGYGVRRAGGGGRGARRVVCSPSADTRECDWPGAARRQGGSAA